MAAHYVKELQEFQPRGPYYLGGFCLGGAIAFEMAQQLVEQGEEVALLALLDGANGFGRPREGFVQSVGVHVRNLAQLGLEEKVAYVRTKGEQVVEKLRNKLRSKEQASSTVRSITGDPPGVERGYVPRPYPGRMVLIRGNDQPARFYLDPYLGWEGLVEGGIDVEYIPVERGYVVDEPYAQETATKLQAYIEEALADCTARAAVAAKAVVAT
jgi:aspartate racemase